MTRFLHLAIILAALVAFSSAAIAQSSDSDSGTVCTKNTYALCTSALCIPDPSAPEEQAICNCNVQQGPNFGIKTSCEERKAVDVMGTTRVISTYSFQEAAVRDVITCTAEEAGPWTDCLDAKCIVDPRNPGKAICTCPYADPGEFVTYGGGCNTDTCATGHWSAATIDAFNAGSAALIATMNLPDGVLPYSFCPAVE